jgi:hypothetical protein
MGKKLGLDKAYNALKTVTGSYPITGGKFPKGSFMERRLEIGAGSGGKKYPSALTTSVNKGSKLLNVGKKVLGKTPIGKAVNLAIAAGTGANIGYEYGKDKFKSFKEDIKRVTGYKTDKKMGGGMMQGYGAARTSGMGLEDQSLMPGQMVRASKGKMLSAKQKKIARMAPPPDKITGADFKAMKAKNGKMVKMNKGGGMDMGNTSARTTAYAKAMAKKDNDRLTENDIKMAEKTLKAYENLKKNK